MDLIDEQSPTVLEAIIDSVGELRKSQMGPNRRAARGAFIDYCKTASAEIGESLSRMSV
jgi:hypothetical protein